MQDKKLPKGRMYVLDEDLEYICSIYNALPEHLPPLKIDIDGKCPDG